MTILRSFLALILAPATAYAQFVGDGGVEYVGGALSTNAGGSFGDIAITVATSALPFVNAAAILTIVVAGLLAVVAQDENRIANARKVLVMAIAAIVLINIAYSIAIAYITAFNFDQGASPEGGANILSTEILGFISFAETPLVIIAIITIIVYGVKAVTDYNGGDTGGQAFKKAIVSVLLGILLITIKFLIADSIVTGNPSGIINPAVSTLFTIVGYAALVAVVVIVLGGIYLILNLADEARATKAKGVIISVSAGLIFMLVISGLLAILIDGVFGGGGSVQPV